MNSIVMFNSVMLLFRFIYFFSFVKVLRLLLVMLLRLFCMMFLLMLIVMINGMINMLFNVLLNMVLLFMINFFFSLMKNLFGCPDRVMLFFMLRYLTVLSLSSIVGFFLWFLNRTLILRMGIRFLCLYLFNNMILFLMMLFNFHLGRFMELTFFMLKWFFFFLFVLLNNMFNLFISMLCLFKMLVVVFNSN